MTRKIITQKSLRKDLNKKNRFKFICPALLALLAFFAVCAPDAAAQDKGRDLVPVFESARPNDESGKTNESATGNRRKKTVGATAGGQTSKTNQANKTNPANQANNSKPAPVYQRIRQKINSGKVARDDKPKRRPNQNITAQNSNQSSQSNQSKQSKQSNQSSQSNQSKRLKESSAANQSKRPKVSGGANQTSGANAANRPPVGAQNNANDLPLSNSQQIGVTIWQLYEARRDAGGEILADALSGNQRLLTPFRVGFDTLFQDGALVRLSIEAAKPGYLYVVNEELYDDDTTGAPQLVFPNGRIGGGDNRVAPGAPVELPDLRGNPFYFEMRRRNTADKTVIAEVLTVVITDRPIANLKTGAQPLEISADNLRQWRDKWAGRAEIFESPDDTRTAYTKAEREAATGARALTIGDALPNTVFLVENKRRGGALITVPLWYEAE